MTDAEHKKAKGWECLLYLKNLKCCTIVKKSGVPDYAWMNQKMASLVSSGKYMASSDMSGIEFYRSHQRKTANPSQWHGCHER